MTALCLNPAPYCPSWVIAVCHPFSATQCKRHSLGAGRCINCVDKPKFGGQGALHKEIAILVSAADHPDTLGTCTSGHPFHAFTLRAGRCS